MRTVVTYSGDTQTVHMIDDNGIQVPMRVYVQCADDDVEMYIFEGISLVMMYPWRDGRHEGECTLRLRSTDHSEYLDKVIEFRIEEDKKDDNYI